LLLSQTDSMPDRYVTLGTLVAQPSATSRLMYSF